MDQTSDKPCGYNHGQATVPGDAPPGVITDAITGSERERLRAKIRALDPVHLAAALNSLAGLEGAATRR